MPESGGFLEVLQNPPHFIPPHLRNPWCVCRSGKTTMGSAVCTRGRAGLSFFSLMTFTFIFLVRSLSDFFWCRRPSFFLVLMQAGLIFIV